MEKTSLQTNIVFLLLILLFSVAGSFSMGGCAGGESDEEATAEEVESVKRFFDADGDGVANGLDLCPDSPTDENADEGGCSASQYPDGDGIADDIDACPGTPSGETPDANGCSASQRDTDGDGIADDIDACPDTPSGETTDENGCFSSAGGTYADYSVTVTRMEQDFYEDHSSGSIIQTRYCYEYPYWENAVLRIDNPSGYTIGQLIFDGGDGEECDVETFWAETSLPADQYTVNVDRAENNLYEDSLSGVMIQTRYCYELAYAENAILLIDNPSGFTIGQLIFDGGDGEECDVDRILAEYGF